MGKTYKDYRKADIRKKKFMKSRMEDEYLEYLEY